MANDRLPESSACPSLHAATCAREIEAAAREAAAARPDFPSDYVDRVHEQSARFALRTAAPDDIRAAVALLEEQTNVQALAPIDARNRGVAAAKKVVRKAVFFAVNHLTEQVRALGWAATSVGTAAAERIEQLEARVLRARSAPRRCSDRLRGPVGVVTEVHQFLPTFAGRDAIGMHTLRLRKLLRDAGFDSDIYAVDTHDDVRAPGARPEDVPRPRRARATTPGSSTTSRSAARSSIIVRELDVPLALDYHNVTDAKFFWRWEPRAATTMLEGRRQLAVAAPAVRFALADSEFNERELIELGCPRTAVAPILIDFADYDTPPDADAPRRAPARARRGRRRLARGRADRAEQVPARRAARVRGVPPHLRPTRPAHARRRPERRSLLAGAAHAAPRTSASPTRSRSPTS